MDWKESNPEKRNGYRGKANREEKKDKGYPRREGRRRRKERLMDVP